MSDADRYVVHRGPDYAFISAHVTLTGAMERAEQLAGKGATYSWQHDGQGGRIHVYTGPRGSFSASDSGHVQVEGR